MEEKQSFCRLCAGRCGVRAMVDEGKLVSVAGDPDDPLGRKGTCNKGRAWPEILNHPNRLRYPQKRVGEPGEGRWRRISWPEALDIIAERLEGYKNEYGPESLILALGEPKGLELAFAQRFASVFGTPNVSTPGHLCHIPRGLASTLTFGTSCVCDEQATPRCIIVWGNNFPDTHDTTMTPQHFNRAVGEGARLIVIDPRKTGLASRASLWLKPRPGTDDALTMGMLKVIVEEELYDRDFVAEWTVGFAELAEHLGKYSLSRIADMTWLPEENIKEAARLYAQNRQGCIILGNALEHTANSIQALRAISILRAITGNLDVPGGELLVGRIPLDRPGHFMLLSKLPRKPEITIGGEFKLAVGAAFTPRQSVIEAILEERPYPVKAGLFFGTNPLLTYPDARKTYDALLKLEFLVVCDLFMTPTAELADIVLPVAGHFEFDEVSPYPANRGYILAYPKIVEPPDECWSDMKIINELMKRVGFAEYSWADEGEALDAILEPAGLDFEQFKKERALAAKSEYLKYKKSGFDTSSGKVEIYSERLENMGYSPLPVYIEPPDTLSPGLADEYPLVLTNAKPKHFCHSAYRSVASLRQRESEPRARLNPETAAGFGMTEGDELFIETKMGRIKQRLEVDEDLDPRVIVADFGWWFPEKGPGDLYGWSIANVNMLTDSAPPHDMAIGSLAVRGFNCRVYKAGS